MSINTKTASDLVHRTAVTWSEKPRDGGRQNLLDTFDLIHERPGQTGRLIVDFSQGAINAINFEEKVRVPQTQLAIMDADAAEESDRSTRGVVTMLPTNGHA